MTLFYALCVLRVLGERTTSRRVSRPIRGRLGRCRGRQRTEDRGRKDRNTLNDHTYTLKVVTAGISGQGSYSITDENGNAAPNVTWDAAATHVTEADFTTTGIVWPHSFSDLKGVPGQSPD